MKAKIFKGKTYPIHSRRDLYHAFLKLKEEGYLAIHGMAFHDTTKNVTVLVIGPSGVGKTTLRKSLKNIKLIHDDKPLLKTYNHNMYVCGHPLSLDDTPYDETPYLLDYIIYLTYANKARTHVFNGDDVLMVLKHSVGINKLTNKETFMNVYSKIPAYMVQTNHSQPIKEAIYKIINTHHEIYLSTEDKQ